MRYATVLGAVGIVLALGSISMGNTLTVGPGQTYTTIQAAVNAAGGGDTIYVLAGTYDTNPTHTQGVVYVEKSLTILGSGPGIKLVDGGAGFGSGGFDTGFSVRADNVTISGFSVTAPGQAIWLESSSNCLIENNIAYGAVWGRGIAAVDNVSAYSGNVIRGNSVYDNVLGIQLWAGTDNLVQGNTVYSNANGIRIDSGYGRASIGNSIIGNTLYSNTSATIAAVNWQFPSGPFGTFSDISINGNDISDAYRGIYIGPNVDATAFAVNYNNIVGNTDYLAKNLGTGTLDATYNWWGATTGPEPGLIIGDVDYEPWLAGPIPEPMTAMGVFGAVAALGAYIRKRRAA